MKNILSLIFFIFLSGTFLAQTQAEMDRQAYADFHKVDDSLNATYQQILTAYKKDTLFIKNLKKAQRLWVKFRDAELAMKYPGYPPPHYGSIQPVCRASYLQKLTERRLKTLKIWVEGIEEGNMCSGSVKRK